MPFLPPSQQRQSTEGRLNKNILITNTDLGWEKGRGNERKQAVTELQVDQQLIVTNMTEQTELQVAVILALQKNIKTEVRAELICSRNDNRHPETVVLKKDCFKDWNIVQLHLAQC